MSDWIDELVKEIRSGNWTVEVSSIAQAREFPIDNPVTGKIEFVATEVPVIEVVFRSVPSGLAT